MILFIWNNLGLIQMTRQRFDCVLLRWRWLDIRMWAALGSDTQTDPTHVRVNTDV